MEISAVIVNYNSWSDTRRLLEKLPDDVEKIVVDNASREKEHVDAHRIIFNQKNEGFASALNRGILASRGDFILILTPDVDFETSIIYDLVEFMKEHPDVAIAVPSALTSSGRTWPMARKVGNPLEFFLCGRRSPISRLFKGCKEQFTYERVKEPFEIEAAVGTFMVLRKSSWEDVGGFDPKLFFYTEDLDISIRLRRKGWKLYILPQYRIIHHVGKVRRAHSFFAESKRTQSFYRFFTKHYPIMRMMKPLIFAGAFLHIAQMGFRHIIGIPPRDPDW